MDDYRGFYVAKCIFNNFRKSLIFVLYPTGHKRSGVSAMIVVIHSLQEIPL